MRDTTDRLHRAGLKLRDESPGDRFERASIELVGVLESELPVDLRPLFLHVKASLRDRRGNREELAAQLERLAVRVAQGT